MTVADEKFLDYGVRGTDMKLFEIRGHWQPRVFPWTLIDWWTNPSEFQNRISSFDCLQAVCLQSPSFRTIMNPRLTQGTRNYYLIAFTNCRIKRDSFDFQTFLHIDCRQFFHKVWLILFLSFLPFEISNLDSGLDFQIWQICE